MAPATMAAVGGESRRPPDKDNVMGQSERETSFPVAPRELAHAAAARSGANGACECFMQIRLINFITTGRLLGAGCALAGKICAPLIDFWSTKELAG